MNQQDLRVYWHDALLAHTTGTGIVSAPGSDLLDVLDAHPDGPERFRNIRSLLRRGPLAPRVTWAQGAPATVDELMSVHAPAHVSAVREACTTGRRIAHIQPGPGTWEAALASAGQALRAVDHLLDTGQWTYSLGRPTGHHAGPASADGFCLFNQEALAAERALQRGLERVAVLDLDVHHGNGTQACFYERRDVLTISLHEPHGSWDPVSHPESGSPEEAGAAAGEGFNVNVELDLGTGDAGYATAMDQVVAPLLSAYHPGLLIVALGQDASAVDPLGRQNLSMAGFRRLGEACALLAQESCAGRLLLIQEGGYQPAYAPLCLHAFLEGLLGTGALLEDPIAFVPDDPRRGADGIAAALAQVAARGPLAGTVP